MLELREEPYVTRRQLAVLLHVSERTIAKWCAEGMPFELLGQRLHRYHLRDIRPWLERRRAEGWR